VLRGECGLVLVIKSRAKMSVMEVRLTGVNWDLSVSIGGGRPGRPLHGNESETLIANRRTGKVKAGGYQSCGCGCSMGDGGGDGDDGDAQQVGGLVADLHAPLAKQQLQGD